MMELCKVSDKGHESGAAEDVDETDLFLISE
jgi:hypothetical protein